jgi:hypothetical protein
VPAYNMDRFHSRIDWDIICQNNLANLVDQEMQCLQSFQLGPLKSRSDMKMINAAISNKVLRPILADQVVFWSRFRMTCSRFRWRATVKFDRIVHGVVVEIITEVAPLIFKGANAPLPSVNLAQNEELRCSRSSPAASVNAILHYID